MAASGKEEFSLQLPLDRAVEERDRWEQAVLEARRQLRAEEDRLTAIEEGLAALTDRLAAASETLAASRARNPTWAAASAQNVEAIRRLRERQTGLAAAQRKVADDARLVLSAKLAEFQKQFRLAEGLAELKQDEIRAAAKKREQQETAEFEDLVIAQSARRGK